MSDKLVFTVDVKDGEAVKKVKLAAKLPTLEHFEEAQRRKNIAFIKALEGKAILRAKLDNYLKEQNLWDEAKQAQVDTLEREIADSEKAIQRGRIKLAEAREIALKLRKLRNDRTEILFVRKQLENATAEGQADNASFNYLVSACVVYNDTDTPYYKDLGDYLAHSNDAIAYAAGSNFASLLYGYDNDFEQKLPENQFLKQYGFVDTQYRLVDKQGRLIDEKGRLINESGELIDEEGNLIDHLGNRIDKDGHYIVDFEPFLDDEGNPVILEKPTTPEETSQETAGELVECEVDNSANTDLPPA